MARFKVYDAFNLETFSFSAWFSNADEWYTGGPFAINGRSYPTYIDYVNRGAPDQSLSLYGAGLQVSDATTLPVSGTVTGMFTWFVNAQDGKWYYNGALTGISVSAAEVATAMSTAGRSDDIQLITKMFAGSDTILL